MLRWIWTQTPIKTLKQNTAVLTLSRAYAPKDAMICRFMPHWS